MIKLRIKKPGLETYLREEILPKYADHDVGHGLAHIERVLNFAYQLSDVLGKKGVDEDLLTTAVICHDLGVTSNSRAGRAGHNVRSAAMVRADKGLSRFFTREEKRAVAMACYEHRASYRGERKDLLSKIVADADTMDSVNFERIILYFEERFAGESDESVIEQMWQHYMRKQHPEKGYARYDLPEAAVMAAPRREFLWKMLVEEGGRERFGVVMKEKMVEMRESGKVADDAKGWGS